MVLAANPASRRTGNEAAGKLRAAIPQETDGGLRLETLQPASIGFK
jgi:hypothetical protein